MSLETIPGLWFPDGNIVIRVGERVCRVHQSILAANSPVLADMFSMPQPRDGEMYEGLPMMSFPDPPEEVVHWLKSMLLLGYFEVYPSRIHQDKLLATLRLSHKYGVQSLRQRALYHLSIAFPDMGSDRAADSKSTPAAIDGGRTVEFFCRVYAVALEIGARWLLPSVMYNIHSATYLDAEARARLPASMASHDMLRLADVARLALIHFQPHDLASALDPGEWGDGRRLCHKDSEKAVRHILEKGFLHLIAHPLTFTNLPGTFLTIAQNPPPVKSFLSTASCETCRKAFLRNYSDACRDFQSALEVTLGIPGQCMDGGRAADTGIDIRAGEFDE